MDYSSKESKIYFIKQILERDMPEEEVQTEINNYILEADKNRIYIDYQEMHDLYKDLANRKNLPIENIYDIEFLESYEIAEQLIKRDLKEKSTIPNNFVKAVLSILPQNISSQYSIEKLLEETTKIPKSVIKAQFRSCKKELEEQYKKRKATLNSASGQVIIKDYKTLIRRAEDIEIICDFALELIELAEIPSTDGSPPQRFGKFKVTYMGADSEVTGIVSLAMSDFGGIKPFKEALKSLSGLIDGTDKDINVLCNYYFKQIPLKVKTGTETLGISTIDGKRIVVTPSATYDVDGNYVQDVIFIKSESIDMSKINRLNGLEYNKEEWETNILPLFLNNVINMHSKHTTLPLLGWLSAIPFEEVLRKDCGMGGFPHVLLTGVHNGGKTTLIRTLMPYLGHGNVTSTPKFSTPFANKMAIGYSYNIPTVFDEYKPHEWTEYKRDTVNVLIRDSYDRGTWDYGLPNGTTREYSYRNPMIIMGQRGFDDIANDERVIPIYLSGNFIKSNQGKQAFKHVQALSDSTNKNFWVGFMIWSLRFTNEQIINLFEEAKGIITKISDKLIGRNIVNPAVVIFGLKILRKLYEDYGLECGYSDDDYIDIISRLANVVEEAANEKGDDLYKLLEDISDYASTFGNTRMEVFGRGKLVDKYEFGNVKNSLLRNKTVLLVKLNPIIQVINRAFNRNHNDQNLQVLLKNAYEYTLQNNGDGLVLAPNGAKTKSGNYTAIDFEKISELELYQFLNQMYDLMAI